MRECLSDFTIGINDSININEIAGRDAECSTSSSRDNATNDSIGFLITFDGILNTKSATAGSKALWALLPTYRSESGFRIVALFVAEIS